MVSLSSGGCQAHQPLAVPGDSKTGETLIVARTIEEYIFAKVVASTNPTLLRLKQQEGLRIYEWVPAYKDCKAAIGIAAENTRYTQGFGAQDEGFPLSTTLTFVAIGPDRITNQITMALQEEFDRFSGIIGTRQDGLDILSCLVSSDTKEKTEDEVFTETLVLNVLFTRLNEPA